MTDDELDIIEKRCLSATAGPWKSFIEGRDHDSGSSFIRTGEDDIYLLGGTHVDQDFVAAARQDVLNLIAEIRRLKKLPGLSNS